MPLNLIIEGVNGFSLPMRDGNDLAKNLAQVLKWGFSLPMRDGNSENPVEL